MKELCKLAPMARQQREHSNHAMLFLFRQKGDEVPATGSQVPPRLDLLFSRYNINAITTTPIG